MDPTHKELLILRRPDLVDNIDITNGLLTHLESRKVLNKRMVQTITYNNPPDRQVEELLNLLPKRGPNAFQLFCEALKATDQDSVVDLLQQREGVDVSLSSSSLSSTSTAAASVSASPLPVAVADTSDVSVPAPIPVVSPSVMTSLSLPLSASVQPSVSADPSSASSSHLSVPPMTPQKRKPVERFAENEDDVHLSNASETDSSPLKRVRSDSGSVICIRGEDEKIIKIYSPIQEERRDHPQDKFVALSQTPEIPAVQVQGQTSQSEVASSQNAFKTDEIRYVMKHYVARDTAETQAENIRLATSMLSDLPEKYLSLLSSKHMPTSKFGREEDLSSEILRERLSRCDSTDTMETRKPHNIRLDVNRKPVEADQTDQSVVRVQSLMSTVPRVPVQAKTLDTTDTPLSVHVELCSRQFYNLNKEKSYRMITMPRGQALIINVNEVAEKPPRRGTDIDRDNLKNLLTQLHFNVTIYNDSDDLTALGMVAKLHDFANKPEHESADACIICLLSHGEEGFMFGTDGKKIPLEEIFLLFDNRHCSALLNKPKIFFIQACRGGMLDHGVKVRYDEPDGGSPLDNNNIVQHPSMSDMLICYPTLQGFYAWRNRERGSWYIESVVKTFMEFAKCEDICAMLNRVNSDVSRKVSRTAVSEMDRMSQMSEYKSSLRKPYLFFYPGIGAP